MQVVVVDLFYMLVDPEAFHPAAYKRIDRMAKTISLKRVERDIADDSMPEENCLSNVFA